MSHPNLDAINRVTRDHIAGIARWIEARLETMSLNEKEAGAFASALPNALRLALLESREGSSALPPWKSCVYIVPQGHRPRR